MPMNWPWHLKQRRQNNVWFSDALKNELKNENIFVGYRGESIQVSPYLYTSSTDIDKLFDVLKGMQKSNNKRCCYCSKR